LTVLLGGVDPATFVPEDDGYIHCIVRPEDTLSGIAYQFGVDPDEIRRLNGITDEDFIVAGQELLIPAGN
jgi:murein DD-endopeptidase MepM/ murein hydrolase activator NlpD